MMKRLVCTLAVLTLLASSCALTASCAATPAPSSGTASVLTTPDAPGTAEEEERGTRVSFGGVSFLLPEGFRMIEKETLTMLVTDGYPADRDVVTLFLSSDPPSSFTEENLLFSLSAAMGKPTAFSCERGERAGMDCLETRAVFETAEGTVRQTLYDFFLDGGTVCFTFTDAGGGGNGGFERIAASFLPADDPANP